MQTRVIKGVTHYVFDNKEEFEKYFLLENGVVPPLKEDWHDGEELDWVVADDGGVVEILEIKVYRRGSGYIQPWVYTTVGCFLKNKNRRDKMPYYMDTDISKHPSRKSLTGKRKNARVTKQLSLKDKAFIFQMIAGVEPVKAVRNSFSTPKPMKKLAELLGTERIIEAMREEVRKIAKQAGYDDKFVLDGLAKLYDSAKSENIKLASIVRLGEIIGTIETEPTKQAGANVAAVFSGFSQKRLKAVNNDKMLGGKHEPEEAKFTEVNAKTDSSKKGSSETGTKADK